jgi:glucokinase
MLVEMVGGQIDLITAQTVYDAALRDDALAREVVRDTARFLGAGIANMLNMLNPNVVVVMGGVTQAGDALMDPLRAEVRRRAFRPAVDVCEIVLGTLPGTAGVVGAIATFKASLGATA